MKKSPKRVEDLKEIKRLEEALRAEQAKSKEYLDQLKYLQADFENYRKRIEKEFSEATHRSNEKLISNLLNVLDDLERAIETGRTTENVGALVEGVGMVHKNFCTVLEREGLMRIEAIGKPFDPNVHDILAKVPTKDQKEGSVVEEVRKGFMFRGRVMRPSVVKIACDEEKRVEEK